MKIGIDVTPVLYEGTGIGEYTKQLVKHLMVQNPEDEFALFYSTMRGFWKIREKLSEFVKGNRGKRGNWGNQGKNTEIKIVGLPVPPAFWQIVWNRLNLIKIEWLIGRVDVFHCWDYLIPPSDCPRVVTIHDITPILYPETHSGKIVSNFKLVLEKIKKEQICVLTDSESSKNDLIKHAGFSENKINVVYLAGKKDWGSQGDWGNKGNRGGKLVINDQLIESNFLLSVGTREPRKNLKKVIEAFGAIAEKYPELELVIAGKYGWGDDNFQFSIFNFQNIKKRIKILGYVSDEDLIRLYKHAICLVYPSLYEGFGLPVLEAINLGCPVITSNASSLPEVGGDAVIYVNPNNTEEIVTSITRVIEAEELRSELVKKGFEQAKKFSWEKCARETMGIYKKVLSIKY